MNDELIKRTTAKLINQTNRAVAEMLRDLSRNPAIQKLTAEKALVLAAQTLEEIKHG